MPGNQFLTGNCCRQYGDRTMEIKRTTCACSLPIFEIKSSQIPPGHNTSSPNPGLATGSAVDAGTIVSERQASSILNCEIRGERYAETHKPRVVIKRAQRRNNQSNPGGRTAQKSGGNTAPSPAFVGSIFTIEVFDNQLASPKDPIVCNQHTGNRSQSTGVAQQPIQDEARG